MATYEVRLTAGADRQLASIYDYIESHSTPAIAQRFVAGIVERCLALAEFPNRGTPRDDLFPGFRTIAHRRRVTIVYAVRADDVVVSGIYYGGQDFETIVSAPT